MFVRPLPDAGILTFYRGAIGVDTRHRARQTEPADIP
jgi:hypothetical protein